MSSPPTTISLIPVHSVSTASSARYSSAFRPTADAFTLIGQVLGHQRDRAPFGGEVQRDGKNARVIVAEAEAVGQRRWIGVVQLDPNGAPEIVDRDGCIQAPVNHPELVKVAQGRTGEVAQFAVVTLAFKLADHHNREHDIVLVETSHRVRITQQDGCVDDVGATA